jgi:uncharacterized protein
MSAEQPIFDFHARVGKEPDAAGLLLARMDACGIGRAAVSAGGVVDLDRLSARIMDGRPPAAAEPVPEARWDPDNDRVRRACAATGGRLVPFYFANPHAGADTYRRDAHAFRGLELSPAVHGVGFDDPRTLALVAVSAEHRHPVYVVCLGWAGSRAADLVTLARRFPSVSFVYGHAGVIGIDTAGIANIAAQDNIFVETSGCLTAVVRIAIDRVGAHRVLFGTEHPLQHAEVELAKYVALGLDGRTWRQIAWLNAHRLLGERAA